MILVRNRILYINIFYKSQRWSDNIFSTLSESKSENKNSLLDNLITLST